MASHSVTPGAYSLVRREGEWDEMLPLCRIADSDVWLCLRGHGRLGGHPVHPGPVVAQQDGGRRLPERPPGRSGRRRQLALHSAGRSISVSAGRPGGPPAHDRGDSLGDSLGGRRRPSPSMHIHLRQPRRSHVATSSVDGRRALPSASAPRVGTDRVGSAVALGRRRRREWDGRRGWGRADKRGRRGGVATAPARTTGRDSARYGPVGSSSAAVAGVGGRSGPKAQGAQREK